MSILATSRITKYEISVDIDPALISPSGRKTYRAEYSVPNFMRTHKSRINELYNLYRDIFNSKEEVLQAIFLNFAKEDDLGKRVLSKLTRDICKHLKIVI